MLFFLLLFAFNNTYAINFLQLSHAQSSSPSKEQKIDSSAYKQNSFTPFADTVQAVLGISIKEKLFEYVRHDNSIIQENPYKNKKAQVRVGSGLPEQERAYLDKRNVVTKKAIEEFLARSLKDAYVPRIAFCASGGGYRALVATIGYLIGAQMIGLLDAITYMATLSGSTWALAPWISIGCPISDFKEYVIPRVSFGLSNIRSVYEVQWILSLLIAKYFYEQPLTWVDPYGALIANALLSHFEQLRQRTYLSDQARQIEQGDKLFPLYTAASVDEGMPTEWYEFSPYEIGGTWLGNGGKWVPSWAFGRKFNYGVSINNAPEQSLGYLMGLFGSAFAANYGQIYEAIDLNIENHHIRQAISKFVASISKKRLTSAEDCNFTAHMPSSPIEHLSTIKLGDAGVDFNVPFPPLLRKERAIDIIIVFDASEYIRGGQELNKATEYAQRNSLKLPQFDVAYIEQQACTIFKNENDPTVPVVIYLPRVKDYTLWNEHKNRQEFASYFYYLDTFDPENCVRNSYADSMNFSYKEWQVRQLSALTEFNIRASKEKIIEAINWVIEQRSMH